MAVIIAAAENESLKDAVFSLRHKVFVEEQNVFEMNGHKRTSDCVDSYPSTFNYIGFLDTRPVACYRVSLDNPFDFPLHGLYELETIRNVTKDGKIGLISLGCIEKDVRSSGLFPLCVYQMGKKLSDSLCDYGAVVIRKDLSEAFTKWGFVPLEHFYCASVKRWLTKMYVEVKNFGKAQGHFLGTAKVGNLTRRMTIYLQDEEVFHFSRLDNLKIKYSHVRVVRGALKVFFNEKYSSTSASSEILRCTQEMKNVGMSVLSKGKTEIEFLLEDHGLAAWSFEKKRYGPEAGSFI